MIAFQFVGLIGALSNLNGSKIGFLADQTYFVSITGGEILGFNLEEGALARQGSQHLLTEDGLGVYPSEAEFLDDQVWLWDHLQKRVAIYQDGDLSGATLENSALMISGSVVSFGQDYVVSDPEGDVLRLISNQGPASFALIDEIGGSSKDTISDVSSLASVHIGSREYLIATSFSESGLSCYERQEDTLVLVDSIGSKDGLWIDGATATTVVDIDGQVFVLASSANANAIVSLRLNEQGVFFPEDQKWDTRDTRFAGVSAMTDFEWQDRQFVIASGDDDGLSLLEVLPGGGLYHHSAIAQEAGWDIGSTTSLAARVIGDEVQVFASGALGAGVAQVSIDLSRTGARIDGTDGADYLSGGWMDDMVLGGDGDDVLIGKAGDDVLIDGAGSDALTGENGADVFVFKGDGSKDRITDFAKGEDRIHLGDWGHIYSWTALQISETSYGAEIVWGDEVLAVFTKNHRPIDISSWGEADFLF